MEKADVWLWCQRARQLRSMLYSCLVSWRLCYFVRHYMHDDINWSILHRYGRRRSRSRSRSVSNSPGGYRGRYRDRSGKQSPRRSPTPRDKRPAISEGLKSRLGPRADDQSFPNKGRPRSRSSSRSKSRGSSLSRSPDSVPPKRQGRAASRSRSSSPSGQQGLVAYGDASPDTGIN
jgi:peptidyl-prolyl isomerase G (cyclophilin G)